MLDRGALRERELAAVEATDALLDDLGQRQDGDALGLLLALQADPAALDGLLAGLALLPGLRLQGWHGPGPPRVGVDGDERGVAGAQEAAGAVDGVLAVDDDADLHGGGEGLVDPGVDDDDLPEPGARPEVQVVEAHRHHVLPAVPLGGDARRGVHPRHDLAAAAAVGLGAEGVGVAGEHQLGHLHLRGGGKPVRCRIGTEGSAAGKFDALEWARISRRSTHAKQLR